MVALKAKEEMRDYPGGPDIVVASLGSSGPRFHVCQH